MQPLFPEAHRERYSTDMKELREKLGTLCIFRDLLEDKVLSSLCTYLEAPGDVALSRGEGETF